MPQRPAPDRSATTKVIDIASHSNRRSRVFSRPSRSDVLAAAEDATRMIAPLWPLESFVAVNPFMGLADMSFADSDDVVDRIWGARLVMPRRFYADAIGSGRISDDDIAAALEELGAHCAGRYSVDIVRSLAVADDPAPEPVATFADALAQISGTDWPDFVVEQISSWAAAYFDEGQAAWSSPWKELPPYAAWKSQTELDRSAELAGAPHFRRIVRALPDDIDEVLACTAERLDLTPEMLDVYFPRLLASIGGWAGHGRFRGWRAELDGGRDDTVRGLLAIRAAWELALFECFGGAPVGEAWASARAGMAEGPGREAMASRNVNLILHTAYEIAGRRPLLEALARADGAPHAVEAPAARPSTQAVFCIDVRSERFRRALEQVAPSIETLGFAGFFGLAIEVADIDQPAGGAHCPVLLEPQFLIREQAYGADPARNAAVAEEVSIARRVSRAWKGFSAAAVSSFAFVESLGLSFAYDLAADTVGRGRGVGNGPRFAPSIEESEIAGRSAGVPLAERLAAARNVLAGMSLTTGMARLVALIGHGSTTANNPYASRLHCGACGGHTGEANARVTARILNDAQVRAALADEGLDIPTDTVFVAGLHDTATDEVTLLDASLVPSSHRGELSAFREQLVTAGRRVRSERAATFGLRPGVATDRSMLGRSRDWSEVRPEWGLAGCAAFIAAPRARTRGTDLGGRSFLHSYEWRADKDFSVLELIMTAPLVVATWISLQYYASTVDNRVFGSGDKTLHNVVGGLGVLEGNGGDLRVGLPWQALHDGERLVHEPMRLIAILEAPVEAITAILMKHPQVRDLADNGWIHLFAIVDEGRSLQRYAGDLRWFDAGEKAGSGGPGIEAIEGSA